MHNRDGIKGYMIYVFHVPMEGWPRRNKQFVLTSGKYQKMHKYILYWNV